MIRFFSSFAALVLAMTGNANAELIRAKFAAPDFYGSFVYDSDTPASFEYADFDNYASGHAGAVLSAHVVYNGENFTFDPFGSNSVDVGYSRSGADDDYITFRASTGDEYILLEYLFDDLKPGPDGLYSLPVRGSYSDVLFGQLEFRQGGHDTVLDSAFTLTLGPVSGVPEISTWMMMILGFGAAGYALRRSNRMSQLRLSTENPEQASNGWSQ